MISVDGFIQMFSHWNLQIFEVVFCLGLLAFSLLVSPGFSGPYGVLYPRKMQKVAIVICSVAVMENYALRGT